MPVYYKYKMKKRRCWTCGAYAFRIHYTGNWKRVHKWAKCEQCGKYVNFGRFPTPKNFWKNLRGIDWR